MDEQRLEEIADPVFELGRMLLEAGIEAKFGLRAQGHLPTVERMHADGASWDDIGKAIGWAGDAVRENYEIETNPRFVNACRVSEEMTDAEVLDALAYCAESWAPDARLHANLRAGDIVRALSSQEEELRKLREELGLARLILNPVCADETLVGAIRNLQQAHLSEKGNCESAEAELQRLREGCQQAFVILEGLRRSVDWELHPSIKALIAEVAPELGRLLASSVEEQATSGAGQVPGKGE